ncbi:endonuclease [Chryseobacterium sp. VAUSW3]|uniref:endonuclease n=1 Tax=Chryseobacterium sp. VAUSW3 TaxID=2010998 RepID=UPI000B4DDE51|nr:endonuclease [Chryseobacterium sp. VAUSW3]OWR13889.1 endonuclease I [Chryseobacterium sp. VAUSW3]
MKRILLLCFLLPALVFSQIPSGYYEGTSNLSGYALKTKLHEIISSKNINWHYGDLTEFYNKTDLDKYYDHDASNTTILLDIYSEIPNGPDVYEYTVANLTGSANAEGQGWNREHMMPQSTFNSNYPMYSDLFYVIPTDARINQLRSNYPYGIAKTTTAPFYTFTNGSRISANGTPGSGYTGRVYEPVDEFKGDIARSLLYFAVRYEGKLGLFNYYNGTSAANDRSPLDGTEEKAFEDWYLAMLLQWHNQDPVSQREIDRNNEVYALQKNRNPFIDYPQWVNAIWNQTANSLEPQAPTNLSITQTSAYFVNLSWTPSPDADVIGYKIYQNDVLIAYTKDTSVSIDHLEPSTFYNFKVQAYDNSYYQSMYSNTVSATTLATDIYAKDLMITKYLEGSENNRAIEITNKTGHPVNLNKYRLSTQFYNNTAGNYYFPDAYELEGLVQHNETFVVLNPYSNFSCITNDEARFVTAAPQLTFSGSQYLELRYASTTVDAVGIKDMSNSSVLGDVSLYRLSSVTQPSNTFTLSEWEAFPADYCENLGVLATSDVGFYSENNWSVYPNPVVGNSLYVKGKQLENAQEISVFDLSGKLVQQESRPFKNKNSVNVQNLKPGVYILNIDHKSLKFIKK